MISRSIFLCLPLSPFYWILFRRDFQVCLPFTGSWFVVISRFVSLCLPSAGSCFVMVSGFVSLCLPSVSSCLSSFVSLCLPSTGSSLSAQMWTSSLPWAHGTPLELMVPMCWRLVWCAVVWFVERLCFALPWTPLTSSAPTGPKSGTCVAFDLQLQDDCGILGLALDKLYRRRGEGARRTMASGEGAQHLMQTFQYAPNIHGIGKAESLGTSRPQQALKRSLLRAQRRARREGWAFYRGNLLSLKDLGGLHDPVPRRDLQRPKPIHTAPSKCHRRVSMMSWNAGGLTSPHYQELLVWLTSQCVDIAVIQGTRWRGERTWRARGYSFIQSGADEETPNVHCALLVCVSDRFCKFDNIAFAVVHPGRLLHVRCKMEHNSLDLINFYQFPTSCTQTRTNPIVARGQLWSQLDALLHTIARRNLLVLAGGFNCPLSKHAQQSVPDDFLEMQELFKKYHLGSVRGNSSTPTFFGNQSSSCIDHIVLPTAQMDSQCRQGRTLPNFPIAGWRANSRPCPSAMLTPPKLEMLVS